MKVSELNISYIGYFLLYASIIESQTSELAEGAQTKHDLYCDITFVCLYCRESIKPLFWLKVIYDLISCFTDAIRYHCYYVGIQDKEQDHDQDQRDILCRQW